MFKEYQVLSRTFPNYAARVELLRALVALHMLAPSELRIIGAI